MPAADGGNEPLRSHDELHEYWADPKDDIDQPENHVDLDATSRVLVELIERYTDETATVLEIGCNVGRNLHHLHDAGYRDLVGVELNGDALDLLAETYPELAASATLHETTAEQFLADLPDDAVDLTFTVATLAHIHPENEFVLDEMVRTTAKYVVTFENEETDSYKQVARNYETEFVDRGCTAIETIDGEAVAANTEQRDAYRIRVFET